MTFNANDDEGLQWGTPDSQTKESRIWHYGVRLHHRKGCFFFVSNGGGIRQQRGTILILGCLQESY